LVILTHQCIKRYRAKSLKTAQFIVHVAFASPFIVQFDTVSIIVGRILRSNNLFACFSESGL
jgi:hypothetical protein